jgi:cysteine desulfurase
VHDIVSDMANLENYFDYAATTPMLPEAARAMEPFFADQFYNPSAIYLGARANRQALDGFRQTVSSGLGVRPTEIVFTAGGTEANNIAIYGVMAQYPNGHIVAAAIEHDSVLKPATQFAHTIVGVDDKGFINVASVAKAITDSTVLVSIMYANNELGTIQPIREIAQHIQEVRNLRKKKGNNTPIYFHTDACQASNYLDMQVSRLGVDLLTINSGKIYGPKQTGALFIRAGIVLKPLILGGGQEWGMRSGTENLANIAGFATAWQKVRNTYHAEAKRLTILRDSCITQLEEIAGLRLNGPKGNNRLANNIHITIAGKDNERMLMELDEAGFQVATGSACSASNDEPSHVLAAIGLTDTDAQNSIRITLGR